MSRIGVYTMANDAVLDWAIAFLRSFRSYNPSAELIVIPFDDRIDKIRRLSEQYNFSLFEDTTVLRKLDGTGDTLFPDKPRKRLFRKYACFQGPFDRFLYLDADIVVLSAVEQFIQAVETAGVDFAFFDRTPEWVYADPDFVLEMKREFNAQQFSTGAFVSRKGLVNLIDLDTIIAKSAWLKTKFPRYVFDQPYLNYLMDTKRYRVAPISGIMPEVHSSIFAGGGPVSAVNRSPVTRLGEILPFIHWAGYHCEATVPHFGIFLHFRLSVEDSRLKRAWCRLRFITPGALYRCAVRSAKWLGRLALNAA